MFSISLYSQRTPDYEEIFGEKYVEALQYLAVEKWIDKGLLNENVNPCFAKAIVFPEVIRYSTLRDKMEMQGLFTLYVQYGSEYANFSVGHFQMKPSFAELIENDIFNYLNSKSPKLSIDTTNTSKARLARVKRLESPQWQLQYLTWFIRLMNKRFEAVNWKSTSEKLVFYATAYNCGYTHNQNYIDAMKTRQLFYTTLISSGTKYNYADISLSYLNTCKPN